MKKIRSRPSIFFGILGILTLISFYTVSSELIAVRQLYLRALTLLVSAFTLLRIVDFLIFQVRDLGERNANFLHRFTTLTIFTVALIIGLSKGLDHPGLQAVLITVRRAIEPVLAGMICLALLYGLFVTAKSKPSAFRSTFLVSVFLFLILFSGLPERLPLTEPVRKTLAFVKTLPIGAIGGLLIGLAIGAIVSAARVLFFAEDPADGERA